MWANTRSLRWWLTERILNNPWFPRPLTWIRFKLFPPEKNIPHNRHYCYDDDTVCIYNTVTKLAPKGSGMPDMGYCPVCNIHDLLIGDQVKCCGINRPAWNHSPEQ